MQNRFPSERSPANRQVLCSSVTTDSVTTDSVTTDSVTTDSVTTDSVTTDSVTTDSVTTDSGTTDSVTTVSGTTDSVTTDSVTTDSVTTDSVTTDSVTTDSVTTVSGTTDSVTTDSVTTDSVTTDSVTTDSVTTDSVTTDSVTTVSGTTDSVTTDSVTTDSVTTDSGTTDSVTTDSVTTDSVTTERVTTDSVTTDSGTTDSVTTVSGTTDSVTTVSGTTDRVTTDSVTTDSVTTDSETTDSVTTDSVTTDSVTTESVTTDSLNVLPFQMVLLNVSLILLPSALHIAIKCAPHRYQVRSTSLPRAFHIATKCVPHRYQVRSISLPTAARVTDLPIKDCHTSDLDLIIVAGYSEDQRQLQLTRTNHIIDYFVQFRLTSKYKLRVAVIGYFEVFFERHGVKTILKFTELNSTYDSRTRFDQSFQQNFNNLYINDGVSIVDYVNDFERASTSIGFQHLTIYLWLCQGNVDLDFGYCFRHDGVQLLPKLNHLILLILRYGSKEILDNNYLHPVQIIKWKDNMSDVSNLGLKLCGKCPEKWLQFESKTKPSFISCYLPYVKEHFISWKEGKKECQEIQSSLINVQATEELEFLQENVYAGFSNQTDCLNKTFPIGLSLISKTLYRRYEWSNGNPLVLKSNLFTNQLPKTSEQDCYVITVSSQNDSRGEFRINSKLVGCETQIINANICKKSFVFILSDSYHRHYSMEGQPHFQSIEDMKIFLFDCGNNRDYVHYLQVCNDYNDCRNGRDEEFCADLPDVKKRNTKRCTSKMDEMGSNLIIHVNKQAYCNGIVDCDGGKDESSCDVCPEVTCFEGKTCLPYSLAHSNSDRCLTCLIVNSTLAESVQGKYLCYTSVKLSPDREIVLCDKSQENILRKQINSSDKKRFSELKWAPACVYLRGMSGPPLGCPDMFHLHNCENFTCPEDMAKCPFSYCIPLRYITDGIQDCLYGEDEVMDIYIANKELERCIKKIGYLRTTSVNVCDDYVDCGTYVDEMNCHYRCPDGFACHGGVVTVDGYDTNVPLNSLQIFDKKAKVLRLSGVNLSSIRSKSEGAQYTFFVIDFSNCSIASDKHNHFLERIDEKTFKSTMLRVVDLSFTRISRLPQEMLLSKNLEFLNLHSANIWSLSWFPRNTVLSVLDLRNNSLEMHSVKMEYFNNLSVSKALYTDHFKLCCPQVMGSGIPKHVCHSPVEAISSCDDLIGDLAKRALLWCVAVTSVVGNVLVLVYRVTFDRLILKRSFGVFVFNLGISDFIMGVYLVLIASVDVYYRQEYVLHESEWRHSSLCKAAGFLSSLSSEVSTFFVLLITVDRFLKFKFPFGQHKFTTVTLSVSVVSAWFSGLVLALIPLVNTKWTIYSSNGMCLGIPLMVDRETGWSYVVSVFIVLNFILFSVIAFGQLTIYRSIESGRSIQACATNVSKRREQEIDIAKQLFFVAMSNFICWLPICVLGIRSISGQAVSAETYSWLVIFVLPLNSAVNPMIYTIPFAYQKWLEFKKGQK
ncbi:hypothetical protein Btru_039530 [Bulinus truncatus]|nr:hypothetical protein Btru_039530 [Bulinus truncatus]